MMSIRSAIPVMAATTSGATSKPSWAAKRAARIIRSGSSEKLSSGRPGVRNARCARSTTPPYGSSNVRSGSEIAIALTVKSRRPRSPARLSPKVTSGLRDDGS